MDDNLLYTDTDPGYSETPLNSGIPPPSIRDTQYSRYNQQQTSDLSKYNPQRQVHLKQHDTTRYSPYPTQQQQQHHHRQHPQPHYQNLIQLHSYNLLFLKHHQHHQQLS
ncbi:unnamed protein product [Cunninghamella blakesleeana]